MREVWRPSGHKRPMLSNGLGRGPGLGFALPALWPLIWHIGLPLVAVGGAVYVASSLAKNALPKIPINTKNVPKASILGGLAAASYVAGPMVSEPYRPIPYIISALGAAAAIYYLFSPDPSEIPGGAPTPAAAGAAYAGVQARIEAPKEWEEVKKSQSLSLKGLVDVYPVTITWVNTGPTALTFNYRFTVTETKNGPFGVSEPTVHYVQPVSSEPELDHVNRLSLNPNDSMPINYLVPLQQSLPILGWSIFDVDFQVEVFNPTINMWVRVSPQRSFTVR